MFYETLHLTVLQLTNPSQFPIKVLVFLWSTRGKLENPEKNPQSKDVNQQQTQPTYDAGSRNQTPVTLVGGEPSLLPLYLL